MVEFKLVISDPKTGKSTQQDVKDANADRLVGLKIGDKIKGETLDLTGYEFEITGGSDNTGFPMRKDISGPIRKRILAVKGTGLKPIKKKRRKNKVFQKYPGTRIRKTVCGNTIHADISQINLKILKAGSKSLFEEAKPEQKTEEKKQEAPKEAPKAEAKPEVKEAPKVEEKKQETPKEENKKE